MTFLDPRERRRRLTAEPFPEEWHRPLEENVLLYRVLSEPDRAKLQDAVRIFIAEKYWEGCGGLEINDEIRLTVAAQACLLVLGFEDYYFHEVQSVLVYPGAYLAEEPGEPADPGRIPYRLGQAQHKGPVVLSWWYARWQARRPGPSNLVLHEFAHLLHLLADVEDVLEGIPPTDDPEVRERWREVTAAEYEQLALDAAYRRPTLLDHYGASNPTEFFAVVTECFFLRPRELRRRHPRLYGVFADWYRQDPAARPPLPEEPAAEAEQAERDYARHVLAEYAALIRRHPESPEGYRGRAGFLSSEGDYDRAVADYSEVIRLCPRDAEAYCDRADAHLGAGSLHEAVEDYGRAIRLSPSDSRAYRGRGAAHARNGDLERALADLNASLRIDPNDDAAHNERGLVHHALGRYDKALRDFGRAIRIYPYRADYFSNRARTHLAEGEHGQAAADCDEALRLDPEDEEARRIRAEAAAAGPGR